ncbi:hypothetical protein AOL_s00076g195 [Orbilia oligospora ATCC 24927]|uniref:F-box domain-containing protein n=2 Tax=Orbilia oligospora TaxID=2813651 RepID=G1X988_ARTOA|nr:hypothetical protein AOL_s00076g195 [Orbilia oligospora ATCC 24927]EGX50431.1 hypothetical protein AOL_s00076g195 [Orbilia oligospora ATCC 24927]KAF3277708.1 hypothetical protein TWF970_004961 [Orbilia oligospora]
MECKSILDWPLDIKLDFLESLDSIASLRSILLTCHIFFDISQTQLWTPIYTKVLERDIGVAGQALVKMRRFKSRRTEVELIEALPTVEDEKPKSRQLHLSELLSVRKPVRFFSHLFFRTRFENRRKKFKIEARPEDILADMKTITESEYARVDEAYYTLWLYKELNYNVELRSLEQVTAMNNWALWEENGSLRVTPDIGILSHVLRVTSTEIIYPYVQHYNRTLSLEELHAIVDVIEALCLYEKHGVASMLITRLGFDGLQKVLESSEEQIQKTISDIYWYPVEAAAQGVTPPNSITQFPSLITDFWRYMEPNYKGDTRRVWKQPGGIYRTTVAPWNQYPPFDITALVWDDERLKSWGYYYPIGMDLGGSKRAYDMTLEDQMCTEDCSILRCTQRNPEDEFSCLGCGFDMAHVPLNKMIDFLNEVLIRSRYRSMGLLE